MTEDATFNALRRSPFSVLKKALEECIDANLPFSPNKRHLLHEVCKAHHWTWDEFATAEQALQNEGFCVAAALSCIQGK